MAHIDDYMIDIVENSWTVVGTSGAGAAVTVTKAAEAKRHHIILKCDASFASSTGSALLEIKFGSTVVAHKDIHGGGAIDFGFLGYENPDANEAVSAVLNLSAGLVGHITLTGTTTGPRAGEAP